jgi:hypothetical protein
MVSLTYGDYAVSAVNGRVVEVYPKLHSESAVIWKKPPAEPKPFLRKA